MNTPTDPPAKLKKADVEKLIAEREQIEAFLTPPPPPPPEPAPAYWKAKAVDRKAEIDALLLPYFFPKPTEGTQRKDKYGFHALAKIEVDRKLDVAALADVVAKCQETATANDISIDVEGLVINWKPALKLREYRDLPEPIRKEFDHALIVTPKPPKFEVARIGQESDETDSEDSEEND